MFGFLCVCMSVATLLVGWVGGLSGAEGFHYSNLGGLLKSKPKTVDKAMPE